MNSKLELEMWLNSVNKAISAGKVSPYLQRIIYPTFISAAVFYSILPSLIISTCLAF